MDNGTHVLPAGFMRMVNMQAKTNNAEAIIQYLIAEEGAITLTDLQQKMLVRAQEADRLIRQGRYSQLEMETMLTKKFEYSRETGRRDLALAEQIFGSTRPRNKHYLLSNHIDTIDTYIRMARDIGDMKSLVALIDAKTKAIKELKEDTSAETAPAAIIFNFGVDNITDLTGEEITEDKARAAARRALDQEEDIDTIEFEEV